jgi:hypothetical protein
MPDYEITVAGRIGSLIASCLPDFRCVAPPATILRVHATGLNAVDDVLGLLADNHLAVIDIRVNRIPAGWNTNGGAG